MNKAIEEALAYQEAHAVSPELAEVAMRMANGLGIPFQEAWNALLKGLRKNAEEDQQ
jgi:hypothetical protein